MKTRLHLSPFSNNRVSRAFFHSALMAAVTLLIALGGVKLLAPLSSSAKHNKRGVVAKQNRQGAAGRQRIAQSSQGGASCPTCSQKQRMIYAPLFDLPESSGSEIVLNSRSAHDLVITPTFYTLEGEAYTGADITLKPNEIRFVNTKSLIPKKERNRHKWGGMALSYVGGFMEAWAQLTLHGIRGGGSINVVFTVLSQKRSNTAEAVWWTPRGGSAAIALGNSSDQPVRANLSFASGESQFVDVRPFATEIVRLNSDVHSSAAADRVEAVSINYVGPEGSLVPTGYTSSANGKFASMIRFYDARQIVQQHLYATNLRIKDARPHMVLRNVSTDFVTATPAFLPPSGDAEQSLKLPPIKLAPSEVVEVDLDPLLEAASNRSDLDSVSVQVSNTGNAGSLIGALYGFNTRIGLTYDVPLRDSGPPRASTGGYSVRLDGDYTTVVAISNTTDQPGEFTMQFNYDGGPYVTGIIRVAPGETKTYDIRKLRDEQIPDINGHPLPRNLEMVQVKWSVRGKVRLNGRAEVISIKDRVSSSYSCFLCCGYSYGGGYITSEGPAIVLPGSTVGFVAWEQDIMSGGQSCGSNPAPYPVSGSWNSNNGSVATVDNFGLATAIGSGFTAISCSWPVFITFFDDLDQQCETFQDTGSAETSMTVVSVTLSATGTQEVGKSDHYISLINTGNVIITATLNPSSTDPSVIEWTGGSAGADNLHRVVSTSSASDTVIAATVVGETDEADTVKIHVVDATTPTPAAVDAPKAFTNGGTVSTEGLFGRFVTFSPTEGVNDPAYNVDAYFASDRWVFRLRNILHTYKLGIDSLGKIDLPVGNPPVFPLVPFRTLEQSHNIARDDLDITGLTAGFGPRRTHYWVRSISENHEQFHVNDYYSQLYWFHFMGLFESEDVEATTVNVIFDCFDTTTTTRSAAITKKTPTWNTAMSNRRSQAFTAYESGAETRAHAATNPQYVPIRNAIPNP